MAGFGSGLVHPLITPAHLLLLIGLGLWLGQRPPLRVRAAMYYFAPLSAVGLLLTTQLSLAPAWQVLLPGMALCVAVLVASSRPALAWMQATLAAVAGMALGLDSGVDAGAPGSAVAVTLLGTWIALNVLLVNLAHYTSLLPQRKWASIGVRIAGSWIAAICVLVLAFAARSA